MQSNAPRTAARERGSIAFTLRIIFLFLLVFMLRDSSIRGASAVIVFDQLVRMDHHVPYADIRVIRRITPFQLKRMIALGQFQVEVDRYSLGGSGLSAQILNMRTIAERVLSLLWGSHTSRISSLT
jgi:hypothetical protein